jgi:hypothetical protein
MEQVVEDTDLLLTVYQMAMLRRIQDKVMVEPLERVLVDHRVSVLLDASF